MSWLNVFILSVVEGLTEFLPVSSTGHLIITSSILGIGEDSFTKAFNIIIQVGAIASVVVIYWRRFLPNLGFYKKLFIAFLPAAVIGLLVKSKIDALLESVLLVGITTLIGGFILIWSDFYFSKPGKANKTIEELPLIQFVKLGFIQCLAFFPGTSRSGATIVGGLFLGLQRKEAAEFSFFLAVPTLAGAAVVKIFGLLKTIDSSQVSTLLIGSAISFVVASITVRFVISVVSKFGFKYFGYYRIFIGIIILVTYFYNS